MGEETLTQTASRFYESFDGSDIEAMLSVFSPELETTDPGSGVATAAEVGADTLQRRLSDELWTSASVSPIPC